jgi:hemin uptake protein HemP
MELRTVRSLKIILIRMKKHSPMDNAKHPRAGGEDRLKSTQQPFGVQSIDSDDIFKGNNEVVIVHAGAAYRLRVTRAGKLILNK